jgi:1-acyl-sn-glycerol-3-phosphate acyltransferase
LAGLPRALRAVWRLSRTTIHVLHGVAIVITRWQGLDAAQRHARVAWWAGKQLRLLGVHQQVQGQFTSGASLLLANHVSWLDIVAIHAICPRARFVSKADVKHWPVLNKLTMAADTLYIERERKRDAMRVVHQTAQALEAGDAVAVFPEGTTGDGRELLPFHGNLLQAAITTGTPVQPLALRYREPGRPVSPAVAWLGETTLASNLWSVACAEGLSVHVRVLPPHTSADADRRELAASLQEVIARALADLDGA